jgi:hypothetical protein
MHYVEFFVMFVQQPKVTATQLAYGETPSWLTLQIDNGAFTPRHVSDYTILNSRHGILNLAHPYALYRTLNNSTKVDRLEEVADNCIGSKPHWSQS